MKKERLITILGPTASGKTDLAVHLAEALGSSIISGDAFQIYKHMDIGTAKVTKEEARGIRHFLVDELEPSEPYSAADFQEKARKLFMRKMKQDGFPSSAAVPASIFRGSLRDIPFFLEGRDGKNLKGYWRRKERKLWKICFVKRGRKIFLPTRSG